ncbi:MAG: transcription termination factor NusA [Planctomycetota bacterium]|nr:MAG: transcription termination factor NusA [Planctomycetota bacterium]
MESELIRLVDSIHRDKSIDKDIIFESIQESLETALRRNYREAREIQVNIDREFGTISAYIDGRILDPKSLGRIAAHSTKTSFNTLMKMAERDVVFHEFTKKVNSIVMGTVLRKEQGFTIVNLGKAEGILPLREQVFNERYKLGERIRVLVLSVEKKGQKVNIRLSRAHPDFVKCLFVSEVPEIADRTIEIKGIAREAGKRTKIALYSNDERVDCIGSCVGVRGSRIKGIINELNGEKVDIVKWNAQIEIYIKEVMSPAAVNRIELDKENFRARVVVPDEQYSLSIGKKGSNIRLASQITKHHLDVITSSQLLREDLIKKLQFNKIPSLNDQEIDSLTISGIQSLEDICDQELEELVKFNFIDDEKAVAILEYSRKVLESEIDGLTPEDYEEIERKVKAESSSELVFNIPSRKKVDIPEETENKDKPVEEESTSEPTENTVEDKEVDGNVVSEEKSEADVEKSETDVEKSETDVEKSETDVAEPVIDEAVSKPVSTETEIEKE